MDQAQINIINLTSNKLDAIKYEDEITKVKA
jgi:hypothetical protein